LYAEGGQPFCGSLEVRIKKLYLPFTLSCVMEVDILQPAVDPSRAVLKLYDWRFAAQLREDNKIGPCTADHESAYIEFVRSGRAQDFLEKLRHDDAFEEPEGGWGIAENEAYLYNECTEMFKAEIAVYNKLQGYQGTRIPRLFGPVTLSIGSPQVEKGIDTTTSDTELLKVNGILIELISGFTLAELNEANSPRTSWQTIVDQAIQNIHIFSDHDILNEDVRTSNILVSPKPGAQCEYQVTMIDFAQCRFREEDESDLHWGRAKWSQDEEGAVGAVMKARLGKIGYDLKYERSMRYLEWAERE
jgi:serine/threonine protein kinase